MSENTLRLPIERPADLRRFDRLHALHVRTESAFEGTVYDTTTVGGGTTAQVVIGNDTDFHVRFNGDPDGWTILEAWREVPAVKAGTPGSAVIEDERVNGYVAGDDTDLSKLLFISERADIRKFADVRDFVADTLTDEKIVKHWTSNDKSVEVADEIADEMYETNDVDGLFPRDEDPDRPRSLYTSARASWDSVLTVANLREQIQQALTRIQKVSDSKPWTVNTITFSSWPYSALGEDTDVEDLKAQTGHRVRMLNAQAEADGSPVRFTLDESASGFRITARKQV